MICPNCGKNVAAEQELCPHCRKPTQFSSRMRYYPKATPLDPPAPKPASPVPASQPPITCKLDPADRNQILGGIEKHVDKKTVIGVRRSLSVLIIGVGILLLLATILINLLFSKSSRVTPSAATAEDIANLYAKTDSIEKTVLTMQNELEKGFSAKSDEILEGISKSTTKKEALIYLYCNDPSNRISLPICFTLQVGEQFILPELYGENQSFLGWSTEKDGDGKTIKAGESITIEENRAFYALWEIINTPSPMPTSTPSPTEASTPLTGGDATDSSPTPTATPRRRW